ncbi:hypothetical protein OIU79_003619, partial [Salix purpurea]
MAVIILRKHHSVALRLLNLGICPKLNML